MKIIVDKIWDFYGNLKEKHKNDADLKELFQVQEVVSQFLENKDADSKQMYAPQIKHSNQQNQIVDWMQ